MLERRALRHVQVFVFSQVPQKQMPQFVRHRGELHVVVVVAVDGHLVTVGQFRLRGTRQHLDRTRLAVACIHLIPYDVLFGHF